MGRYVYQPILLPDSTKAYQEEEFLKNYFKSIKTGCFIYNKEAFLK